MDDEEGKELEREREDDVNVRDKECVKRGRGKDTHKLRRINLFVEHNNTH